MNNNTGSYENPMFLNYSEMYQQKLNLEANNTALRNENAAWQYQNATLQSQNENLTNAYNAVVERANGMHMADVNTIARLTGTIASMKAARELSSRRFEIAGNSNYFCTEPSGKKREVGYFKVLNNYVLAATEYEEENMFLVIQYETGIGNEQTAVIPFSDIGNKKLINHFQLLRFKCSKEIANDCLSSIMFKLMEANPPLLSIPEFPGIELDVSNDGVISAEFRCSEEKLPVEFREYVSFPYYKKYLPAAKGTASKIFQKCNDYLSSPDVTIMMCFGLTGILSPYLHYICCNPSPVLVVSCNSIEGEFLASCMMKTYGREKPPKSLTSSKYELTSLLEDCYGETVVFIDDTVSEKCRKRNNSLDTLLSSRSDSNCNPFNIAVISKEAQYIIPNGKSIILETDSDFGKNFSGKDRYIMSEAFNEMTRYFAENFCKHIDEYGSMLKASIDRITSECRDDFSSSTLCNAFAVLYSVYIVWCSIFNVHPDESFKEYSKKLIINSQDIKTGKDYLVVNSFFKVINSLIAEKKVSVKKLGRQMNYVEDSDAVIIDGDTILIEE